MGKRVRAALHAMRVAAEAPGATEATKQIFDANMASFYAAEQTKRRGFFNRLAYKTKNSILNPSVAYKDVGDTLRAGLKGGTDKRALLRGQHEKLIHPFQSTAQTLVTSERMVRSDDPAVVAQGIELKRIADAKSLRNAKTGAAVGIAFVGASALGSGSAAGSAGGQSAGQTLGKYLGTTGAKLVAEATQKKESQTGLADTAKSNGDGMDPTTRANYNAFVSRAAERFFGAGGAVATGGGATTCGAAGHGDPWLFCLGAALVIISIVLRIVPWRR